MILLLPILGIIVGLVLLLWSADRFIEGSAVTARHFGMPPLLIGMVVVGFGTSAPEMLVSALASVQGNAGIALGNAYGSNITNIALILGITALISPITVHSQVLRKELPILIVVTGLAAWQLWDTHLSRLDALVLLGTFFALVGWTIVQGIRCQGDPLADDVIEEPGIQAMPLRPAVRRLIFGLVVLIASSRLLVWSAVEISEMLGVSDLIVGLTVVAVGTSLPELASSIIAARKGAHDIALGNILGSNLFNTLAVVGIAGTIRPMYVGTEVLSRDMVVMAGLTLILFLFAYGFRKQGRINRVEGGVLVTVYVGYTLYLVATVMAS